MSTKIIENLSRDLQVALGAKLDSILLYGSILYKKEDLPDIDIILVLQERESAHDLESINNVWLKYTPKIDIQVVNLRDIQSKNFSHDSHGEFFIKCIKKVPRVIYGNNPFLKLSVPYTKQISSLIKKLQYYFFQVKKRMIHSEHILSEFEYYQFRKSLLKTLVDFNIAYTGQIIDRTNTSILRGVVKLLNLNLTSSEENFLFNNSNKLNLREILNLYCGVYYRAIDKLTKDSQKETFNVNGIFTEISKVEHNNRRCVLIASGLPSNYNEQEIVTFFNIQGYDAASFHYRGTGLSEYTTKITIEEDFRDVYTFLQGKYSEILVIGNSFGAYPIIKNIKLIAGAKIILVSPVVNFSSVVGIKTLPAYLKKQKSLEYKWSLDAMVNFISRQDTISNLNDTRHDVYVLHGEHDEQIPFQVIKDFCLKNNINLVKLNAGHVSLNKLAADSIEDLYQIIK